MLNSICPEKFAVMTEAITKISCHDIAITKKKILATSYILVGQLYTGGNKPYPCSLMVHSLLFAKTLSNISCAALAGDLLF